jgi:hypothetical protein
VIPVRYELDFVSQKTSFCIAIAVKTPILTWFCPVADMIELVSGTAEYYFGKTSLLRGSALVQGSRGSVIRFD